MKGDAVCFEKGRNIAFFIILLTIGLPRCRAIARLTILLQRKSAEIWEFQNRNNHYVEA